jgi:flavin-dependent dehydrogenase
MEAYPVVIVGAGPAGCACAKALQDEGVEALMVESETLPRHKICSGVLFGQTQVLLKQMFGGLPPQHVYCDPHTIAAAGIQEWRDDQGWVPYVWELPKGAQSFPDTYLNIWRKAFDSWLVTASGARCRDNCPVRSVSDTGEGVSVTLLQRDRLQVDTRNKDGGLQTITCRYLVGADGGNSRVRACVDSVSGQGPEIVIYQAYFRFEDTGSWQDGSWNVFFKPEIGDILACVHRKDDLLTLCVGGMKGRNLKHSMQAFKDFLAGHFQIVFGDLERVEGCLMRPGPAFLGVGRVLLAGEAAGLIYLNGEGISAALDSGYRAGTSIANAVKNGGDALGLYAGSMEDVLQHAQVCAQNMHFMAVA